MTHLRWAAAVIGAALSATAARSQGILLDPNGLGVGGRGAIVSVGRSHGRTQYSLSIGAFSGYGYPGGGFYGPYPSISQVSVYYAPPPPTVIVAPAADRAEMAAMALDLLRRRVREDPRYEPPAEEFDGQPPPVPLPPKADAPKPPPKVEQPKPPPKVEQPKPPPAKPPDAPKPPPEPPKALDDPVAENARLVSLGRDAFAAGEYGRAAERFRKATTVAPAPPLAHFLLAQSLLALGKYREAVDAVHAGLAAQPDWPTGRFHARDLYGANAAEFTDHLKALEDALNRRADDPVLLFLYGYALWFDGRQDDARLRFRRALPADPAAGTFLRAGGLCIPPSPQR
jgi:tetratricopeptide (TPR) repeat protein